jgi:hypothetical protein
MISADRQQLEAEIKKQTHDIREKELDVFEDNFAVLATTSSFLTGLGFKGLTMVPVWGGNTGDEETKVQIEVRARLETAPPSAISYRLPTFTKAGC